MRRTILFLAALLAFAPAVLAGDDPAKPPANPPATPASNDAAAAQFLKELAPQIGKQADADAKAAVKKLVEIWKDKDVTDAVKKPIPDLIERFAKTDTPVVALDGIAALGELGPAAGGGPTVAVLERALKAKTPDKETYHACFASLKKLADPKAATVKTLEDALKFRMDDVIARALDAMAGYKEAPGKVRKEMLEEVIKLSEGVSQGAQSGKNATLVAKWTAIKSPAMAALEALAHQGFKDPIEARSWFNDHKGDKSWNN